MIYPLLIKPLLFRLEPERAHEMIAAFLSSRLSRPLLACHRLLQPGFDPILRTELCGMALPHPIGLAAGFDKNANMAARLHLLGFSFAEIGTVTAHAQPGNPKPRIFRLPADGALINRMGFNNAGAPALAARMATHRLRLPIGGNIGKSKVTPLDEAEGDYEQSFRLLKPVVDYFVINVSSPNTPDLRKLQSRAPLSRLLQRLSALNREPRLPLFLKIAPDLSPDELADIVSVVVANGIDGVVATNTTIARTNLKTDADQIRRIGDGGLSGLPLRERSTQIIRALRRALPARVRIIGVGGIFDGRDAYEKIRNGADCVQIYSGLVYRGPGAVFRIAAELAALLKKDGFTQVAQAVGADLTDG